MNSEIELPIPVLNHIRMWSLAENKSQEQIIEELIVAGACARLVEETARGVS